MTRPLLLGMNNPISSDPEYDLYPYPEGCTGWRIWKMLPEGTTRQQYLRAFDRRNLLRRRDWDPKAAQTAAVELLPELRGRVVVVLGTQVRAALGLLESEPLSVHTFEEGEDHFLWVAFPHPSGRNRWFNSKENYTRASELLTRLFRGELPVV